MKIIINNKENTQPVTGQTLGEVLIQIQETGVKEHAIINHLRINDQEMDPNSQEVHQTPVAEINTLEIETSSLSQIISKNISNAESYLQKLIPGIEKAAHLFRTGNEQEANKFFINIIEGMEWLSQVLDTVVKALGLENDSRLYGGKSIADRKTQLIDLTRQLLDANKSKDWVLVADLLEYEILPFYAEWVDFLPQINELGSDPSL